MKPDHYAPKGKTFNTEPTLTDQSQAYDTDINVIVGKFGIGQVHGASGTPMYEDWTQLPTDLRERIELARSLPDNLAKLPEQLRSLPLEELIALTNEQLLAKLKPAEKPAETPAPPAEEKK